MRRFCLFHIQCKRDRSWKNITNYRLERSLSNDRREAGVALLLVIASLSLYPAALIALGRGGGEKKGQKEEVSSMGLDPTQALRELSRP